MLYRVWNQGHREPGAQAVLKVVPTGLSPDNGDHLARLQGCDKDTELRVGVVVRVRDDVDIRVGAVDLPAGGEDGDGRVGLVPTQHGGMADLHVVHSMDAASLLLHCKHICQAQQLYQLQAPRTQDHPGLKLQGQTLQQRLFSQAVES